MDVPSFLSPSRGSRSAESLCRNWMACFSLLCCLMAAASRTPESRRFSVRITVYMPSRCVRVCGRLRSHLRGPVTIERTTTNPGDAHSSTGREETLTGPKSRVFTPTLPVETFKIKPPLLFKRTLCRCPFCHLNLQSGILILRLFWPMINISTMVAKSAQGVGHSC